VSPDAGVAKAAMAAADIDFADDASAEEFRRVGFFDDTDELVSRNPAVPHIPPRYFQIGIADAGHQHPDERFRRMSPGRRIIRMQFQIAVTEQCSHVNKRIGRQSAEQRTD
jgi:hypothetical protein